MATSLVSTGVQFPDSTIQTTAATASPPSPLTLISTTTADAVTTVDIPITGSYAFYDLVVISYRANSAGAYIQFKYTQDNFATFPTWAGTTAYGGSLQGVYFVNTQSSYNVFGTAMSPQNTGNPAFNVGMSFRTTCYNFNSSTRHKMISSNLTGRADVVGYIGAVHVTAGAHTIGDQVAPVNGIRINAGNGVAISCIVKLYGYN